MKRAFLLILLALALLLPGCASKQTKPIFLPEETNTLQDVPQASQDIAVSESPFVLPTDPSEAVLAAVDQVLQTENLCLSCWFSHGSGPTLIDMDGYQNEIRAAFAQLTWTSLEHIDSEEPRQPADWSFSLSHGNNLQLRGDTDSDILSVYIYNGSGTEHHFYHAEGAASLPFMLADLYDGPHIRYCLTEVPESAGPNDQALAEAFSAAFEKAYLASGAISDFQLRTLTISDNAEDSLWRCFRMAFAVKPASPANPCWQNLSADNDGWISFENELALYLDEDAVWRCDWFQT